MLKRLYPNTLLKKLLLSFLLASCLLVGAMSLTSSRWISRMMKPQQEHDLALLSEGIATKVSYILRMNTQYLLKYASNAALLNEMISEADENNIITEEEINSQLRPDGSGSTQPGAIVSSRCVLAIKDGTTIYCGEGAARYGKLAANADWMADFLQYSGEVLSSGETGQHYPLQYSYVFSAEPDSDPVIALSMRRYYNDHDFVFVMIEPFSDFEAILSEYDSSGFVDYCLLGRKDEVLWSEYDTPLTDKMSQEQVSGLYSDDQYTQSVNEIGDYVYFGTRISFVSEDLKLIASIPSSTMMAPYQIYIQRLVFIFVLFAAILVMVMIILVWRMLKKMRQLVSQMQTTDPTKARPERIVQSNDEIGVLAETYYDLMDQVHDNVQVIREKEEREKKIEYSLLISQIDPHLIYNTLNTITYLAELQCTDDIQVLNRSLISMLRDRLKISSLKIYDTLEHEITQLQNYITIQKYLCNGDLTLEMDVSEECMEMSYPKNILQPFVENSILHGLLVHRDPDGHLIPGVIRIRIQKEGVSLSTEIDDNGVGMTSEEIEQYFVEMKELAVGSDETRGDHIGIYNIRARLSYLYGDHVYICAERSADLGGTHIHLVFPCGDGTDSARH